MLSWLGGAVVDRSGVRRSPIGVLSVALAVGMVAVLSGSTPSNGFLDQAAGKKKSQALPATASQPRPHSIALAQSKAAQGEMIRQAWLVQTDDFTERLSSESFWRRGKRRGSSRSYRRNSAGSRRMKLGRPLKGRNPGLYIDEDRKIDRGSVDAEGSEFYSGNGNTYRTVCVRSCDGYFSPISFSTTRNKFRRDQAICESRCGGGKLYVYKNPGETPEDMVDLNGNAYSKLKTAFLFRTKYISACTCKALPWQQASRDRHKLYALKAAVRKSRGRKRRLAKAAVRKFRKIMRQRGRVASLQISVAGQTRNDAVFSSAALSGQGLSADALEKLEKRRIASFSPIRSLPKTLLPSVAEQSAAMEGVARLVTPQNDDAEVYLPVRNPMRVLSSLSRPDEGPAILRKAELEPSAAAGSTASKLTTDAVIAKNDDQAIVLPSRNRLRRGAKLTAVRSARLWLNSSALTVAASQRWGLAKKARYALKRRQVGQMRLGVSLARSKRSQSPGGPRQRRKLKVRSSDWRRAALNTDN